MRYSHLFLLLFLIPCFLFASTKKKCAEHNDKATIEWNQSSKLIEQFHKTDPNQAELCIHILRDAIACCQRAIHHFDKILKKIEHHPRKHPWDPRKMKKQCKQDRKTCLARLNELQNTLGIALYAESLKKADLAKTKEHEFPRRLNAIEAVVQALNEAEKLYKEAASLANDACSLTSTSDKAFLRQTAQDFQENANRCQKEASQWPDTVLAQKSILKEQFALLKEEHRLLEERDQRRSSFEVQKKMASLLEELIESGEKEPFENELAQLKKNSALREKEAESSRLTENTPLAKT